MAETPPTAPLDLSAIEGLDTGAPPSTTPAPAAQPTTAVVVSQDSALDARLVPQPRAARLVEVSKLGAEDLEAANHSAAAIDFRKTGILLAHGDGVLAGIAQASRQLLTGVRLGDAGEVGQIAAAVIDGVKILRIQDLQAEAEGRPAGRPQGSRRQASRAWRPMRTPPSRASRKTARNSST